MVSNCTGDLSATARSQLTFPFTLRARGRRDALDRGYCIAVTHPDISGFVLLRRFFRPGRAGLSVLAANGGLSASSRNRTDMFVPTRVAVSDRWISSFAEDARRVVPCNIFDTPFTDPNVFPAALFYQSPVGQVFRPGATDHIETLWSRESPLRHQWRKDGVISRIRRLLGNEQLFIDHSLRCMPCSGVYDVVMTSPCGPPWAPRLSHRGRLPFGDFKATLRFSIHDSRPLISKAGMNHNLAADFDRNSRSPVQTGSLLFAWFSRCTGPVAEKSSRAARRATRHLEPHGSRLVAPVEHVSAVARDAGPPWSRRSIRSS